jgi:hypothetical protein
MTNDPKPEKPIDGDHAPDGVAEERAQSTHEASGTEGRPTAVGRAAGVVERVRSVDLSSSLGQIRTWSVERVGGAKVWWRGEDPDEILERNRFMLRYASPDVVPVHAAHALVAASAAAGLTAAEGILMRSTRSVMDSDAGFVQQAWGKIFPARESAAGVSIWMDQVPGAANAGGWAHRLEHGHDLDALTQIISTDGLPGAAEWFNHVLLRDFWTPHGVPYLPRGSAGVYEWLVSHGVSKAAAADLLTINAAEFFAGVFYARAVYAAWKAYLGWSRRRELNRMWERASSFDEEENHDAAIEQYARLARVGSEDGDAVPTLVALAHLQAATTASEPEARRRRAHEAYSHANSVLSRGTPDVTLRLNGAQLSARGLAGYILAGSAAARLGQGEPGEFDAGKLRSSVTAFLGAGERLASARIPGRARPYSATANRLLALELRYGLNDHPSLLDPIKMRSRILAELACVLERLPENSESRRAKVMQLERGVEAAFPMGS